MLLIGVLAAVVLGLNLTLRCVTRLTRAGHRRTPVAVLGLGADRVAVLIIAHDGERIVTRTIDAIGDQVPRDRVFLVADHSTDRTVELARAHGVNVLETAPHSARTEIVSEAITCFGLGRYDALLVIDAGTAIAPGFLGTALPLLDDPEVVAVVGCTHNDGPLSRVLTAYRARMFALAGYLVDLGGAGWPVSGIFTMSSPATLYRTSVLAHVEIDADFDPAMEIHRRRLGRVALAPGACAFRQDVRHLGDHLWDTVRWARGFWRTARPRQPNVIVAETLLRSATLVLAPAVIATLAVTGLLSGTFAWQLVVFGLLLPDYLLSVAVAVSERQPRYLLFGLVFLPLRVLDAVVVLATLFLSRSAAPKAARLRRVGIAIGGFALLGGAGAFVARVGFATTTLPSSVAERGLVNSAFGAVVEPAARIPGPGPGLLASERALRWFAQVGNAFDRHGTVLVAARELAVWSTGVAMLGLLLVAVLARLGLLSMVVTFVLLAVSWPAIAAFGTVGPGVLGAAALSIGVALVLTRSRWFAVVGVLVSAVALVIAPVLAVPVFVGVAAATRIPIWGRIAAALAAGGSLAAVLLLVDPPASAAVTEGQRLGLLVIAVLMAAGGVLVPRVRAAAGGVAAATALLALLGSSVDALLPALVLASAFVGAGLLNAALTLPLVPDGERSPRRAALVGSSVVAVALAVVGVLLTSGVRSDPDHRAVADWAAGQADPSTVLTLPPELWADVCRDLDEPGVTAPTLRYGDTVTAAPRELAATVGGAPPAGAAVAMFGGPRPVTVALGTGSDAEQAKAKRAELGAQLADNERVRTSSNVRAALRTGQVDVRPMALIATISADHDIEVSQVRTAPAEIGLALPDHVITVASVDGQSTAEPAVANELRAWLAAQLPPFAPSSTEATAQGVVVVWRVPAPDEISTR